MLRLFKGNKGRQAHMGQENQMYFNKELGRWVERGKEHEVVDDAVPPPPFAASAPTSTPKRVDEGDPSSRYVAAGDFGKRTSPGSEEKKTFVTPPTFAATAPATGGFFVPTPPPVPLISETETSEPRSPQGVERYKGYCIPTFAKPEGFPGTQEEYAAAELQKFKEKIDRREARKNTSAPKTAPVTEAKENGVLYHSPKTGGAKLDDSWLTENGGYASDHQQQQFQLNDETVKPQDAIDEIFGPLSPADPFAAPQAADLGTESQTAELFPVEPERQPETRHVFDQPFQTVAPDPFSGQAAVTQWTQPAAEELSYPAAASEAAANDGWSLSDVPTEMAGNGQSDRMETQTIPGDSHVTQDQVYAEAEYPGIASQTLFRHFLSGGF